VLFFRSLVASSETTWSWLATSEAIGCHEVHSGGGQVALQIHHLHLERRLLLSRGLGGGDIGGPLGDFIDGRRGSPCFSISAST
jgi:hypothetical protein